LGELHFELQLLPIAQLSMLPIPAAQNCPSYRCRYRARRPACRWATRSSTRQVGTVDSTVDSGWGSRSGEGGANDRCREGGLTIGVEPTLERGPRWRTEPEGPPSTRRVGDIGGTGKVDDD
jgi:hypothetical protein